MFSIMSIVYVIVNGVNSNEFIPVGSGIPGKKEGKRMSEWIKVAVDAMGGDYAPKEPVKGAVEAVNEKEELFIYLVGQEAAIQKELEQYTYPKDRIQVVAAE